MTDKNAKEIVDIPAVMSGFELISSAIPSASDVADSRSIRGLLTQAV